MSRNPIKVTKTQINFDQNPLRINFIDIETSHSVFLLYNATGRLIDQFYLNGEKELILSHYKYPSGLYLYRLKNEKLDIRGKHLIVNDYFP